MAIFNVITFLIKAIVGAIASLLAAVFLHVVPALLALVVIMALIFAVCTSCGLGGLAVLKRRRRRS